jgi:phosphate transport system permease protein
VRLGTSLLAGGVFAAGIWILAGALGRLTVSSGTNALNASIILGIMALPTVVSVSEDALNAVGRELREGSYALGATRAETLLRVVVPAAKSGILAAVILGVMRAIGETMVVWMASGNAAKIPHPWFNLLEPVRTLTATIAGDMGEADHVYGSSRYHVLFAMALCLLAVAFVMNLLSELAVRRVRRGRT